MEWVHGPLGEGPPRSFVVIVDGLAVGLRVEG